MFERTPLSPTPLVFAPVYHLPPPPRPHWPAAGDGHDHLPSAVLLRLRWRDPHASQARPARHGAPPQRPHKRTGRRRRGGGDTTGLKCGGFFSDSTAFIFLLAKFDNNFSFNMFSMSKKIQNWRGKNTSNYFYLIVTQTHIVIFSLFCLAFFSLGRGVRRRVDCKFSRLQRYAPERVQQVI